MQQACDCGRYAYADCQSCGQPKCPDCCERNSLGQMECRLCATVRQQAESERAAAARASHLLATVHYDSLPAGDAKQLAAYLSGQNDDFGVTFRLGRRPEQHLREALALLKPTAVVRGHGKGLSLLERRKQYPVYRRMSAILRKQSVVVTLADGRSGMVTPVDGAWCLTSVSSLRAVTREDVLALRHGYKLGLDD